jgi:DNA mismatch endonuclease, patch repair protein
MDAATRSRIMGRIRSKDTKPELLVRRGLHKRGFRFRLHDRTLPGRPDLILRKHRVAIFVHGCFWHGHDCPLFRWPRTREDFWRTKITTNRDRDERAVAQLVTSGWRVLTVWECAFRGRSESDQNAALDTVAYWIANDAETVGTLAA